MGFWLCQSAIFLDEDLMCEKSPSATTRMCMGRCCEEVVISRRSVLVVLNKIFKQ